MTKKIFLISLFWLFTLSACYCFAGQIQENGGLVMKEGGHAFLNDGFETKCSMVYWFAQTTDFVSCDKGNCVEEFPIADVDLSKTFGKDVAREYEAMKRDLKQKYERHKTEIAANITTQGISDGFLQMKEEAQKEAEEARERRKTEAEKREREEKERAWKEKIATLRAETEEIKAQTRAMVRRMNESFEKNLARAKARSKGRTKDDPIGMSRTEARGAFGMPTHKLEWTNANGSGETWRYSRRNKTIDISFEKGRLTSRIDYEELEDQRHREKRKHCENKRKHKKREHIEKKDWGRKREI